MKNLKNNFETKHWKRRFVKYFNCMKIHSVHEHEKHNLSYMKNIEHRPHADSILYEVNHIKYERYDKTKY